LKNGVNCCNNKSASLRTRRLSERLKCTSVRLNAEKCLSLRSSADGSRLKPWKKPCARRTKTTKNKWRQTKNLNQISTKKSRNLKNL